MNKYNPRNPCRRVVEKKVAEIEAHYTKRAKKLDAVICTYVKLCTYYDLYGITLLFTHTCEYYQTRLDLHIYTLR